MTSSAMQIRDYLASLEPSRASMIRKLRTLVRKHLPTGYCEAFDWGMIAYQVPLGRHADTYNGRPLLYVGLGAQKDHASIYLSGLYMDPPARKRFEKELRQAGVRRKPGKSCVRIGFEETIPAALLSRVIAAYEVEDFIRLYVKVRGPRKTGRSGIRSAP